MATNMENKPSNAQGASGESWNVEWKDDNWNIDWGMSPKANDVGDTKDGALKETAVADMSTPSGTSEYNYGLDRGEREASIEAKKGRVFEKIRNSIEARAALLLVFAMTVATAVGIAHQAGGGSVDEHQPTLVASEMQDEEVEEYYGDIHQPTSASEMQDEEVEEYYDGTTRWVLQDGTEVGGGGGSFSASTEEINTATEQGPSAPSMKIATDEVHHNVEPRPSAEDFGHNVEPRPSAEDLSQNEEFSYSIDDIKRLNSFANSLKNDQSFGDAINGYGVDAQELIREITSIEGN